MGGRGGDRCVGASARKLISAEVLCHVIRALYRNCVCGNCDAIECWRKMMGCRRGGSIQMPLNDDNTGGASLTHRPQTSN